MISRFRDLVLVFRSGQGGFVFGWMRFDAVLSIRNDIDDSAHDLSILYIR